MRIKLDFDDVFVEVRLVEVKPASINKHYACHQIVNEVEDRHDLSHSKVKPTDAHVAKWI